MIVRLVKLTFEPKHIEAFQRHFEAHHTAIRQSEGCQHLALWQDQADHRVFFTYSWWTNHEALENYRHSQLFKDVWQYTRELFAERPQAWTLAQKISL